MTTEHDEKVAGLRTRIEELKLQLAKAKAQRDSAKAERDDIAVRFQQFRETANFQAECDAFRQWCTHLGPPCFFNDSLVTWQRNMDSLQSPKFHAAYQRGMNSGHIIGRPKDSDADIHIEWRVHTALWAASHAAGLEGDFVECGVNTGIVSIAICDYLDFNSLNKDFYLFDTYCGIPEEQMSEEERDERIPHNRQNYEECFETAVRNFSPWPRCRLVRGKVPDTLDDVSISKVSYLHIDMNIAAPERAALEYFWDKMVPGGIVLLDDYGSSEYREQYDSANEFAAGKGVMIATLPTGQGLMIKR